MKRPLLCGLALGCELLCLACVPVHPPAVPKPSAATRIVVENSTGAILGQGVFPGKASDFTVREASPDGVEVVRSFSSEETTRAFRATLNSILADLGRRRLSARSLRRALDRGQLTCHDAMYMTGPIFLGVGLRRCGYALVFGLERWDSSRPLNEQIGFLREEDAEPPVEYGARGVLPESMVDRKPAPPEPPADTLARRVPWEDLLRYLDAAVTLEEIGDGDITTKTCVENLGPLMDDDPDLGNAVVHALTQFQLSQELAKRFVYPHRRDVDFPTQVFVEPGIREALAPFLAAQGIEIE